jgi:hypothetical protein
MRYGRRRKKIVTRNSCISSNYFHSSRHRYPLHYLSLIFSEHVVVDSADVMTLDETLNVDGRCCIVQDDDVIPK